MKTFNFFEKLWEHSRTLRRVGLVLVMCLMAIPQLWGYSMEIYFCPEDLWGGYWDEDTKYCQLNLNKRCNGNDAWETYSMTKTAWTKDGKAIWKGNPTNLCNDGAQQIQFLRKRKSDNYQEWSDQKYDGWMMYNSTNTFYYGSWQALSKDQYVNGGYVYFDNSQTGWTTTYKYLVIGRDAYSRVYALTRITNTDLWYVYLDGETNHTWEDATYCAFIGSDAEWGDGDFGPSTITDASKYTATYPVNYSNSILTGRYYLYRPASSSDGAELSRDNYASYTGLNWDITFKAKIKAFGEDSYAEGTSKGKVGVNRYNYAAATSCNSSGSNSSVLAVGGTSGTYAMGYVSTRCTLTVANVVTGYTFRGWYAGGTKLSDDTPYRTYSPRETTVYAYFEENSYTITYNNMTGATNHPSNPSSYGVTSSTITLQAPTKDGYVFAGWCSDEDCKTRVTSIPTGSTGNKVFYAKWLSAHEPGKYTATGSGGYGKTLKDVSGVGGYERYVFGVSSSKVYVGADTKTTSTGGACVLSYATATGNFDSGGEWLSGTAVSNTSSATTLDITGTEFASSGSVQGLKHSAEGQGLLLNVKGYTEFAIVAKDNDATKGNKKYLQVLVNGSDVTDNLSTDKTRRSYSLTAGTRYTIQIKSLSSSENQFWGFSLKPGTPTITVHPSTSSASYDVGDAATALSVTATKLVSSGTTLSYQWYSNTTASNTGGTIIGGATSASYTPPTTSAGTTYYYCVVSETGCNSATSNVSGAITVTAACTTPTASWATAPANGNVGGNMNATLTTNYATGVVYTSSNTDVATVSGDGTTTCTINYVAAGTARITATVTGDGATICTGPATCYTDITVSRNTPTAYAVTGTAAICSGGNTDIALANSQTGASYQLKKDGVAEGDAKAGTGEALTWNVSAAGTYTVSAVQTTKYSALDMTGSAVITFKTNTAIETQPTSIAKANVGAEQTLSVVATGSNLEYQWYSCSDAEKTGATELTGEKGYELSVTPAAVGVIYYYCVVSGDCGDDVTSNVVSITAKNAISPTLTYASTSIAVGAVTAVPTVGGNTGSGSVSYTSSATGVATVDSDGKVTAKAVGSATITATIAETASYWGNTATATFTIGKGSISPTLSYDAATLTVGGNSSSPTITGNTGSGTVTYEVTASSPSGSVTVNSETGVVTAVHPGTATITASIAQTTNYNSGSATASFTITKANISPTLSYASTSLVVGDETDEPTVDGNPGSGTVTYEVTSASPSGCITVDEDGKVTAVKAGTATVTATIAATTDYNSNTATATFTVSACSPITASVTFDNNKSAKYNTSWEDSDVTTSGGASWNKSGVGTDTGHKMTPMAMKLDGDDDYIKITLPTGVTSGSITVKACTWDGASGTLIINSSNSTSTPLSSTEVGLEGKDATYKINDADAGTWTAPTLKTVTYDEISAGGDYYIKRGSSKSIYVFSVIATGTKPCTATTYTVTYANGGATGDVPVDASSPYEEGATVTVLDKGSLAKTGYSFAGWNDGSTDYDADDTFTMPAEDVTLTAQWTEDTHMVSVAAGAHGTVSPSSVSGVGIATASGNITATPATGYSFNGWTLPSGVTAAAGKTASSNPIQINATADDKTITATWTTVSYTITYNLNSGSLDGSQKTSYNIETEDYDLPTPTRDDYVFQGWYTDEDFTSDRVYTLAEGSTGDKTYYAKWADGVEIEWTITKVGDKLYKGGTGYSVKAVVNNTSWTGHDNLVLSASDGVTLGTPTKSTVDSKAQIVADFSISGSLAEDAITFSLYAPATGVYAAIEDEEEVDLDDCPGGSVTNITIFDGTISTNPAPNADDGTAGLTYKKGKQYTDGTTGFKYKLVGIKDGLADISEATYTGKGDEVNAIQWGGSSTSYYGEYIVPKGYTASITVTYVLTSNASKYIGFGSTKSATPNGSNYTSNATISSNNVVGTSTFSSISEGTYYFLCSGGDKFLILAMSATLTSSDGGVATSLAWSSSLADKATVNKNDVDLDFRYYASPTPSNAGGPISYTSSKESVATVSSDGTVHIVNDGSTTITASMPAFGCYSAASSITYSLVVANTCSDTPGTIVNNDGSAIAGDAVNRGACETLILRLTGHSGSTIQWKKDGADIDGATEATYSVPRGESGVYTAVVRGGCDLEATNSITVTTAGVPEPTIFADDFYVKSGKWFGYRLMQINRGETVTVKTAPTGWTENTDFSITTDASGIVSISGRKTISTPANKTLTLTIANECGGSVDKNITIREMAATAKPTIAWIATNNKGGSGQKDNVKADESTNTDLYDYLKDDYIITPRNCYWTTNEADLVKEYSQYDLIILTDYPNSGTCPSGKSGKSNSYTNAIGLLIDHKPIMTFEAFVAGCPNWGIASDPKNTQTTQADMTLLCNADEIFGTSGKFGAGQAITVTSASSGQALQGFPVASSPDFVFIGKITDSDEKTYVACCERQHEIAARMMVFGLNSSIMSSLTANGKTMVEGFIEYLLKDDPASVPDCSVIFNGGGGDNSWYNTSNWEAGLLPDQYASVRIDAPCVVPENANPAKAGGIKIHVGDAFNGSLTIEPEGRMIVEKTITRIEGNAYTIHMPTEPEDLIIQSNSTAQGALIFDNESARTQATVEMYSKGRYYDGVYNWQYVAVPLVSASRWNMGDWAYCFDNSIGNWTGNDVCPAFSAVGVTRMDDELPTYVFSGPLASTKNQTLTLYTSAAGNDGYNMIGNSWTAPIQIVNFQPGDFGTARYQVNIYNTGHDPEGGPAAEESKDQQGRWKTIPIASAQAAIDAGTWADLKVIPSMQAFEVQNETGANTTLTLNYDRLVRTLPTEPNLNETKRAPRRTPVERTAVPQMRITLKDETTRENLYLFSGEQFSEGFDNGWDGVYNAGEAGYMQIYMLSPIGNLEISAQPEMEGTTFGFTAGSREVYTFSFKYVGNEELYFNDLKEKKSTLINDENEYTFTAQEGENGIRFMISATPYNSQQITTGMTDLDAEAPQAQKVIYNDKLYIIRGGKVFSADGHLVK